MYPDDENQLNVVQPAEVLQSNFSDSERQDNLEFAESSLPSSYKASFRRRLLAMAIIPSVAALMLIALVLTILSNINSSDTSNSASNLPIVAIDTSKLPGVNSTSGFESISDITFSDKVIADAGVVLTPSTEPADPITGQLYFDDNENILKVYDGSSYQSVVASSSGSAVCFIGEECGFITQGQLTAAISAIPSTNSATSVLGVSSINSLSGVVSIQGTANQVSISSSGGAINLSLPQSIAQSSSPTFRSLSISQSLGLGADTVTSLTGNGLTIVSGELTVDTGIINGVFSDGGNSFGATATLGTNDSNSLVFETNNQSALTIASGGAVILRNATNSTNAFDVRNSAGVSVLNVDTLGKSLTIGSATTVPYMFTTTQKVTYDSTPSPFGVASADFNNDGCIDLATPNMNSNVAFSVFISNCDGTFADKVAYNGWGSPVIATADYDGDGFTDIAVEGNDYSVDIYINNGDGTFGAMVGYSTSYNLSNIISADFNGDGYQDLATTGSDWSFNNKELSILLNNGDGTFADRDVYTDSPPTSITVDNFNGDGYPDIAIVWNELGLSGVSIFLNNGDGSLGAPVDYTLNDAEFLTSIVSGDFDSDGHKDIAVSNSINGGYDAGTILVLMNNGDGSFASSVDYAAGEGPSIGDPADFDGDGFLDLVVINGGGDFAYSDLVSIYINNGYGNFAEKIDFNAETLSSVGRIEPADFNDDNKLDLAVVSQGGDLSIFTNQRFATSILTVFDSAGSNRLFNVDAYGNALFKGTVNSSSAFNIQNASGDSIFNVNTQNQIVSVSADILPSFDATYNLGSDTNRWVDLFLSGNTIHLGSSTSDEATIGYNTSTNNMVLGTTTGGVLVKNAIDTATAFEVQNASGTSVFTVDTDSQFVGIGVNEPTHKLHVVGDTKLDGTVTTGDLLPVTGGSTTLGVSISEIISTDSIYNSNQKQVAKGNDNLLRFVYVDNGNTDVHFVRCMDIDCLAESDTIVASDLSQINSPIIVLGTDGYARIAYTTYNSPNELHYITCQDELCTTSNDQVVASSDWFGYIDFAIGTDGFARIFYDDWDTADKVVIKCEDDFCTSKISTVVANSSSDYSVSIVLNSSNYPIVAYFNFDDSVVVYIQCLDTDCTTNTQNNIIASPGPEYFDMELGVDGNIRIAYIDPLGTGLLLVSCLDSACSSVNTKVLDDNVLPGQVSLNIDQNGYPRIAYQTSGLGVEYVACSDVNCSGFATRTIDTAGNYPVSMATGNDNLSSIIYGTVANNNIKLARILTWDGKAFVVEGPNVGGETNYFGQAYLQGLSIKGGSANSLLTLDQYYFDSGNLIDFNIAGTNLGTLGLTTSSVEFRDTAGSSVLGVDTIKRSVNVAGDTNIAGRLSIVGGSNSEFSIQNTSGSNIFNVDTYNKTITLGGISDSGMFSQPVLIANNEDTRSMSADFNNDGHPDIASVSGNSDIVSVFVNNGDGTFATQTDYSTGDTPSSITVADFNNDGFVDMAVPYVGSGYGTSIYINNGDGTFASKVDYTATYSTAYGTDSVVATDFNGDGYADIAEANGTGVSLLINNGDGTFASEIEYSIGGSPISLTASDFNGDGSADIATANHGDGSVSIIMNNGDGTFGSDVDYAIGDGSGYPWIISSGDFNGDGSADVVSANNGSEIVSVLINNGDGTFAAKVDYDIGGSLVSSIVVDDLNNDGFVDIAFGRSSYYISVLINNGDGTFASGLNIATSSSTYSLSSADFNSDGSIDLAYGGGEGINSKLSIMLSSYYKIKVFSKPVLSMYSNGNDVLRVQGLGEKQILKIDHQGSVTIGGNSSIDADEFFTTKTDYTSGLGPYSSTSADFNGDGYPDVVTANYNSGGFGTDTVSVLINNGDGSFAAKVDYETGGYEPGSIAAEDFNGDGFIDVSVIARDYWGSNYYLRILYNNGDGTFASGVAVASNSFWYFAVTSIGDFNGDGNIDIVIANSNDTVIYTLINNGDGTFVSYGHVGINWSNQSVATGDLNGDGYSDLVVTDLYSSKIAVLISNGDGTFTSGVEYETGTGPRSVTLDDYNNDGSIDIATANGGDTNNGLPNSVSILINNSDGTFINKIDYELSVNPLDSIDSADINGDGYKDLLVGSGYFDRTYLLLNNGDGTFANKLDSAIFGYSITTDDFDKDGKVDLAITDGTDTVSVFINQIGTRTSTGRLTVYDTNGVGKIFNVGMDGSVISRNLTNSTTAFSIQNTDGESLVSVDTQNSKVTVQSPVDNINAFSVENSSGSSLLTIDTLGSSVIVKSPTDSASAFSVQNASSVTVLGVDTLSGTIVSALADGETSVGFTLNVTNSYVTGGSKLLSVQNNGTERFAIDKDGHIVSASPAPTAVTIDTNAGVGGSPSCSIAGNDTAGTITIVTGTGAQTAGVWCRATIAFDRMPRPVVSATDQASAALMPYMSADESSFTFGVNVTGIASSTYTFNYFMPQ